MASEMMYRSGGVRSPRTSLSRSPSVASAATRTATATATASPAQSVRTRLPGAGVVARSSDPDDASGVSTRRVPLPYHILSVSHEAAAYPACNLLQANPVQRGGGKAAVRTYWSATYRNGVDLVLGLEERCLLSVLLLDNKTASAFTVSVATANTPKQFLPVKTMHRCPHGKLLSIKMGHIPCDFVKLSFHGGTPPAVYSIRLVGMPVPTVMPLLGPTLDTLLVQKTSDILFGSSLHAALPTTCRELQARRLPAPKVALELDDYDTAPALIDLVLRRNYAALDDALAEDDDLEC